MQVSLTFLFFEVYICKVRVRVVNCVARGYSVCLDASSS